MIMPTIHSNGTSAESLREQYVSAHHAADAAMKAVAKIDFNGRDYYPQGADAFSQAQAEFQKHVQAMATSMKYFMDVAMHCDKFCK